mgnify:CR=1 FL=1
MKIKTEQLQRTLKEALPKLIWIASDERLLLDEAADLIRDHYRQAGFLEREILNVDQNFNWEDFNQSSGSLSLFAENKIIELRMQFAKMKDTGKLALQSYVDEGDGSLLALVTSPRLEKGTKNAKWFKKLEAASVLVEIWPIDRHGMGPWLEQRLLREGIKTEADALQQLVDRTEGNLLAAVQEVTKLKMLAGNKSGESITLDARTVNQVVADSTRFNAFQAIDAALGGEIERTQKILTGLRAEDVHPLMLLGAITRELRSLISMLEKKEQGQGVNAILQSYRVIFHRKQVVGQALQRLKIPELWRLLEQARVVDQSIKGMHASDCWLELSVLLTRLAGKEPWPPRVA